ncbi:SAV_915 family protein [Kitasatospora sp. LaBMicrA B282]|uniref:SAV_915 family protein n=1 Tax=Kitasatospora sp. LaBMicrA B282 TaxID=3420949 RepID=UPI003D129CCA
MKQQRIAEAPEPEDRIPAGHLLVPIRSGPLGHTPRFFRTPLGARTAVAFSSGEQLAAVLGAAQPWIVLAEPALRALAAPLGVSTLTVDPQLAAPAPTPLPTAPAAPGPALPRRCAAPARA